ncbi:sensor histidine kinase [Thermosediminibacter oceani]|uniref:histidine kinase n=1 Tax=Thermosediminibacter oceani (strain ATCC BAA-1034 / DSM 16646 / JW/IW-1228P) TaxID=555079 RepID=D9RZ20_THEOJ|nr:HAMP domain-containing sensor histidine kinase [Thermosediminibacter oceani]ADL08574.1 integral membrane sensor signal transduction histidine kinase [Thermosediminibacter oceani DSM 16646]
MRSIELRILIPILIIIVFSLTVVGFTSYYGSYRIIQDLVSRFPESSAYIDDEFITNRLFDLQKYTILVAIIAILASSQLTIFFAYSLVLPIKKFAAACDELAKGNFNAKVDYRRNDEIGILKNAFNAMAEKLKKYIDDVLRLTELNQKILNGINYGILLFSKDHKILLSNKAANNIFETSPSLSEWAKDFIREYPEGTIPSKGMAKWPSSGGMTKFIQYEVTPTGENFILCFSDVTEEEKLKHKMEHINRLASIGEMSAALAHEIRNPLQGIQSCFQVLESLNLPGTNETSVELFSAIYREIDRINRIITSLLHYARPSEPMPARVSLKRTVEEIRPFIVPLLKEKALDLRCSLPEGSDEVYIDPNHLKQILMNLITNAIRASRQGGFINVSLHQTFDETVICVRDKGIGIPKQHLSRIFTPFFTTFPGGTGLGLCVVQSLTIKNRGRIWIESTEDSGTSVYLAFPSSFSHKMSENVD